MAKIKILQPFSVRLEGEAELLAFPVGVHEVSEEVLAHWFVRVCINDGRAVLLSEAVPTQEQEVPLTEEQLRAISNRDLIKIAQARGLTVPDRATKDQLVALLREADPADNLATALADDLADDLVQEEE